MFFFHLCYHGACRKQTAYVAKTGDGYCSKHTLLIVEKEGMNVFWPHFHDQILQDFRHREIREDNKKEKQEKREKQEREEIKQSIDVMIFNEIAKRNIKLEL